MAVPALTPRPRRIVPRTLGLGIGSLVVAGILTLAPTVATGWDQGSAEATLWQLLNGARANNGMAPVQSHGTLIGLARWRSSDMLANDYFSHTIPACGCLVYTYYDSNGLSYVWGGENIGWNSGLDDAYSPVRVHEQFMGSPGHRSNVLNASFTHGGVGAAAADGQMFQGYVQNTRMYAELFMQAPSAPAPAPAPAPQPAPQPATQPAPAPSSGGGGGTAARPAAPATAPAQQAARAREAKPKRVSVDSPARPRSTTGIDGVGTVVSAPRGTALGAHLRADEIAAVRAAAMPATSGTVTASAPTAATAAAPLEVTAVEPEPSVFEGIVGAILGFLFG